MKHVVLEKKRILDLFGAAGNLHMIIFEILFKNPFLLKTATLLMMQTLNEKGSEKLSFAKSVFEGCKLQLETKFKRLLALDTVLDASASRHPAGVVVANEDDAESMETSVDKKSVDEDGILHKIRNGIWTYEKTEIEGLNNTAKKYSRNKSLKFLKKHYLVYVVLLRKPNCLNKARTFIE